jgi:hypothetical protein
MLRELDTSFQVSCATTILTYAADGSLACGATFMVIICAFACEYLDRVSVRPSDILEWMSGRLASCPRRFS